MVISEANEAESIIAALLAALASSTISEMKTARTGAKFKAMAEASKAASHYRAPGKNWQMGRLITGQH